AALDVLGAVQPRAEYRDASVLDALSQTGEPQRHPAAPDAGQAAGGERGAEADGRSSGWSRLVHRRIADPRRHLPVRLHACCRRRRLRPSTLPARGPLDGATEGPAPLSGDGRLIPSTLCLPEAPPLATSPTKPAAPRGAASFVSFSCSFGRFPVAQPLMPHATAAWLVENTSLTFEQIAEFCGLHILEVQAIADDTAATKLTGRDPIRAG